MVSSGRNGTKEWVRAAQAAPPSHSVRAGCQHALPIQPSTVEWTARAARSAGQPEADQPEADRPVCSIVWPHPYMYNKVK